MAGRMSRVEIGTLDEQDSWKLESRYFPSKVGGKPAWLDLRNISIDIRCGTCSNPCIFLCQLYAPIHRKANAFHRTIFVFICKNPQCYKGNANDFIKVFRCQLPEVNDFYVVEDPEDENPNWHPESQVDNFSPTCVVCGCYGPHRCGKCQVTKYCSKEHQRLDWKSGHKEFCGKEINRKPSNSNILFPEYELGMSDESVFDTDADSDEYDDDDFLAGSDVEDDEDEYEGFDDDDTDDEYDEVEKQINREEMKKFCKFLGEARDGTPADMLLDIMELNACKSDKYLYNYKKRLNLLPNQVVRYRRGGPPLYITKPTITTDDIPNCELCQGPRQFEFQILSTMLGYLEVDSLEDSIDWGNIMVYTCKNHCSEGPAYKKEFVWIQNI